MYLEPEGRHSPRRVFRRCGEGWEWAAYEGDMRRWFGFYGSFSDEWSKITVDARGDLCDT